MATFQRPASKGGERKKRSAGNVGNGKLWRVIGARSGWTLLSGGLERGMWRLARRCYDAHYSEARPIDQYEASWRSDRDRTPCHSPRSEEHTSELQPPCNLVCRLLLETKVHAMSLLWTRDIDRARLSIPFEVRRK